MSTPLGAIVTPSGHINLAFVPNPSADPDDPDRPANVLTNPNDVTLRMVCLQLSATYMFPLLSTAKPSGLQNDAYVPYPSADPCAPAVPAMVLTTPEDDTLRRRIFATSPM
jgi:hypothetical protein